MPDRSRDSTTIHMKIVVILGLVMVLTACSRDDGLTERHIWTQKQFIEAIDQDPGRQDIWVQKEIGPDLFMVVGPNGRFLKRE